MLLDAVDVVGIVLIVVECAHDFRTVVVKAQAVPVVGAFDIVPWAARRRSVVVVEVIRGQIKAVFPVRGVAITRCDVRGDVIISLLGIRRDIVPLNPAVPRRH